MQTAATGQALRRGLRLSTLRWGLHSGRPLLSVAGQALRGRGTARCRETSGGFPKGHRAEHGSTVGSGRKWIRLAGDGAGVGTADGVPQGSGDPKLRRRCKGVALARAIELGRRTRGLCGSGVLHGRAAREPRLRGVLLCRASTLLARRREVPRDWSGSAEGELGGLAGCAGGSLTLCRRLLDVGRSNVDGLW